MGTVQYVAVTFAQLQQMQMTTIEALASVGISGSLTSNEQQLHTISAKEPWYFAVPERSPLYLVHREEISMYIPSSTGLDWSNCSLTRFTCSPFPHTAATYDIISLLASEGRGKVGGAMTGACMQSTEVGSLMRLEVRYPFFKSQKQYFHQPQCWS